MPALQAVEGVTETDADIARRARASRWSSSRAGTWPARSTPCRRPSTRDRPARGCRPPRGHAPRMARPGDRCGAHRARRVDQLGRFADDFVVRLFEAGVTRTTIRGIAAPRHDRGAGANLIRHDMTLADIAGRRRRGRAAPPGRGRRHARVRTGAARAAREIAGNRAAQPTRRLDPDRGRRGARSASSGVDRERPISWATTRRSRCAWTARRGATRSPSSAPSRGRGGLNRDPARRRRIDLIRTRAEAISDRLNFLLDNG